MPETSPRAGFQLVPYALLDEPEIAARETMDDQAMLDLVESIRKIGLLQPLGVVKSGERYRISYGHRRYKACGLVPLDPVPCMVFPEGTDDEEALKVAENNDREELNVGEEALYLNDLLERRCGADVDRLCAYVKKKRQWVEDRLLLLNGDIEVLQALRDRRIKFAVAKELNKVADLGARRQFLDAALRGGATGALIRRWREEHEAFQARQSPASGDTDPAAPTPVVQPADSPMRCVDCGSADDFHEMELLYIHRSCKRRIDRAREAAAQRETHP